jgi:Flp pilus assembly protein TadG
MIRTRSRLRARRGAVLILVALSMSFIMAMVAFTVETSRLMADASELQSLTDASALAGVYGLVKSRDAAKYVVIGDSTATLNKVEGESQAVTYRYGKWDATTRTFDSSGAVTIANADAVQATATLSATHFLGGFLGTTNAYSIKRSSIAWAGGSINSTRCLKPWALPIEAVKAQLGYPAGNNTPLTEADIGALNAGVADDTITVKHGGGGDFSTGTTQFPGAFGAVDMGGGNGGGASTYEDAIEDRSCAEPLISMGDQVPSEQGNMAGPTRKGVCDLCACSSPSGQNDFACSPVYPVTIIIYSAVSGGHPNYTVGYFGVFNITGYHGKGQDGQVTGYLGGLSQPGSGFSPIPGPVTKFVLVK